MRPRTKPTEVCARCAEKATEQWPDRLHWWTRCKAWFALHIKPSGGPGA